MSEKLIPSDKLILFCGSFFLIGIIFLCIGDTEGDTATTVGLYCILFGIIGPLVVMAFRSVINKTFDPTVKRAATVEAKKRGLAEQKF